MSRCFSPIVPIFEISTIKERYAKGLKFYLHILPVSTGISKTFPSAVVSFAYSLFFSSTIGTNYWTLPIVYFKNSASLPRSEESLFTKFESFL